MPKGNNLARARAHRVLVTCLYSYILGINRCWPMTCLLVPCDDDEFVDVISRRRHFSFSLLHSDTVDVYVSSASADRTAASRSCLLRFGGTWQGRVRRDGSRVKRARFSNQNGLAGNWLATHGGRLGASWQLEDFIGWTEAFAGDADTPRFGCGADSLGIASGSVGVRSCG